MASVPHEDEPARPKLRLFSVDAAEHAPEGVISGGFELSPQSTLGEVYRQFFRPVCLARARSRNIKQYDESMGYWARFTGEPPVYGVDDYTLAGLLRGLGTLPGRDAPTIGDNTIRKHCVHIQAVLDRLGPPTRQVPEALGLISRPLVIRKPALIVPEVEDNFTLQEIGWWLEACRFAKTPRSMRRILRDVKAAQWWRSLIVFDYNVGVRIETLLLAEWTWITQDKKHGWSWLNVPDHAIKGRKRKRFYLNQWALAALEPLKALGTPRLFPWSCGERWIQRSREKMMEQSRIPADRRFGFHGLRKALATELGAISPLAAQMALGHGGRNVTRDNYTNRKVMVEAMDKLPQPKWDDQQTWLF